MALPPGYEYGNYQVLHKGPATNAGYQLLQKVVANLHIHRQIDRVTSKIEKAVSNACRFHPKSRRFSYWRKVAKNWSARLDALYPDSEPIPYGEE